MPDLLLWREQKVGLDGVPLTEEQSALEWVTGGEPMQEERKDKKGLGYGEGLEELGGRDGVLKSGQKETGLIAVRKGIGAGNSNGVKEGVSDGVKEGVDFQVRREAKLVEVKGPRDRLSEQQRAWIGALQAAGIAVEVCKVVEEYGQEKGPKTERKRKK
jgi:hypothetical protein